MTPACEASPLNIAVTVYVPEARPSTPKTPVPFESISTIYDLLLSTWTSTDGAEVKI